MFKIKVQYSNHQLERHGNGVDDAWQLARVGADNHNGPPFGQRDDMVASRSTSRPPCPATALACRNNEKRVRSNERPLIGLLALALAGNAPLSLRA